MIHIHKLHIATPEAADVAKIFDMKKLRWKRIKNVNWKNYPYKPAVLVRMAHNGESIFIEFDVTEASVASVAGVDNGRVWEDSCCEFFCMPSQDGIYYNFECNCTGQLLIGCGQQRENRQLAPQAILDQVSRWSSLGNKPFAERIEPTHWRLAMVIPVRAFFMHDLEDLSGRKLLVNLYKCGDKLQRPHFLSFFPIEIEKPDFHRPDFFQPIRLEKR